MHEIRALRYQHGAMQRTRSEADVVGYVRKIGDSFIDQM